VLDASLRWWDVDTGKQLRSAELPVNVIFQVAISPDGRTALIASDHPAVTVWTWKRGNQSGNWKVTRQRLPPLNSLRMGTSALAERGWQLDPVGCNCQEGDPQDVRSRRGIVVVWRSARMGA